MDLIPSHPSHPVKFISLICAALVFSGGHLAGEQIYEDTFSDMLPAENESAGWRNVGLLSKRWQEKSGFLISPKDDTAWAQSSLNCLDVFQLPEEGEELIFTLNIDRVVIDQGASAKGPDVCLYFRLVDARTEPGRIIRPELANPHLTINSFLDDRDRDSPFIEVQADNSMGKEDAKTDGRVVNWKFFEEPGEWVIKMTRQACMMYVNDTMVGGFPLEKRGFGTEPGEAFSEGFFPVIYFGNMGDGKGAATVDSLIVTNNTNFN